MQIRNAAIALAGTILMGVLVGCGTIIHGSTQDVSISSTPAGAEVSIDGADVGETPLTQSLDRGSQHTIKLSLDGYESESIMVNKSASGWVAGNIIFGGLIGLAVDAATGGMYKLDPTDISREMDAATASQLKEDGSVYVTVVMNPDPEWEKIGELEPAK